MGVTHRIADYRSVAFTFTGSYETWITKFWPVLVNDAVAIIVDSITNFLTRISGLSATLDARTVLIADKDTYSFAGADTINTRCSSQGPKLVDCAVTVVVKTITNFYLTRVNEIVSVVTVGAVGNVSRRLVD